jgi:hypothetical protein
MAATEEIRYALFNFKFTKTYALLKFKLHKEIKFIDSEENI